MEFQRMVKGMQREARDLLKSFVQLSYFTRASVTYEQMFWKTYAERELIKEFLDERFEIEAKNPHPVY